MNQFLVGTPNAFAALEDQAKQGCIRYRNQPLPPDCCPGYADIGFEVDQESNTARILVTKGIRYTGSENTIREWLADGVKEFTSFSSLTDWIKGPLSRAFAAYPAAGGTHGIRSGSITDMDSIRQGLIDTDKPLYLNEDALFSQLKRYVVGQDDALKGLSATVVRHLARKQPSRPAVIFAVGPSGVGKTRTAETLTTALRSLQDSEGSYQFLRLDMSEYQEAYRVSQLIGSPQGYVGHGNGSQLLDTLHANPRTIVLFDEIEKAHPSVLRVLMNAMDAGRLSSSVQKNGAHEIDCRHAIFIFTSNLSSPEILAELESRSAFGNRTIEDEVCRRRLNASGIAAEIIGRIGRFIVYHPLSTEIKAEILSLAIAEIAQEYGLQVDYIQPSVIIELMQYSRSQGFGARPEKYLIDELLGPCFTMAAQQGLPNPVEIAGPPFVCTALQNNE